MRLFVCSVLACAFPSVSARALVTVLGSSPWTYRARIAAFGDQMEEGVMNSANLLLPPDKDDPFLCETPDVEFWSSSVDSLVNGLPSDDTALFVSRGECPFEQKAQNAAMLRKNVTDTLRYLIVYNNDDNYRNELLVMSSSSRDDELENLKSLGLIFVSTNTGIKVLQGIKKESNLFGSSPYFLHPNSGGWEMPILVEKLPPPEETGFGSVTSNGGNDSSRGEDLFYWLRFVLFALLILAPCCRAGCLWYNAGGRLYLRRDDSGRITGLLYVRPQPYWFTGGRGAPSPDNDVADRLTKEQVLALPVIEYRGETLDTTAEETEISIGLDESATIDGEESTVTDEQEDGAEEDAVIRSSCTTCSICIDDFEEGEQLRVLPRCHHAFHTDCIMPWLTERQGCCPLCKTSALESEGDEEADTHAEGSSFDTDE